MKIKSKKKILSTDQNSGQIHVKICDQKTVKKNAKIKVKDRVYKRLSIFEGIGDVIVDIFPQTCEEICGSLEKNKKAASITEKFIWMLVLAELLILIIWSIDVLVDDEKKDVRYLLVFA